MVEGQAKKYQQQEHPSPISFFCSSLIAIISSLSHNYHELSISRTTQARRGRHDLYLRGMWF